MVVARQPNKAILVIDDNQDIREMLTQILSLEGYCVYSVINGIEGIKFLCNGKLPDLILLDIAMEQMNGWEFLIRIKNDPILAAIPVIIISGHNIHKEKALSLGAAACFAKPLDFDLLLDNTCIIMSAMKATATTGAVIR